MPHRNMIRPQKYLLLLSFIFGIFLSWDTAQAAPKSVEFRIQIYRLTSSISGDITLNDNLWEGIPGPDPKTKEAFSFFNQAKLRLGDQELTVSGNTWKMNGNDLNDNGKIGSLIPAVMIPVGSPAVVAIEGERSSIGINSNQPFEYFVPRMSHFVKKEMTLPVGLKIAVSPRSGPKNRILLEKFEVKTSVVESRKPVKGTSLNVGEPVLAERVFEATINVRQATDYGFLLRAEKEGVFLVRFRADWVKEKSMESQIPAQKAVQITGDSK